MRWERCEIVTNICTRGFGTVEWEPQRNCRLPLYESCSEYGKVIATRLTPQNWVIWSVTIPSLPMRPCHGHISGIISFGRELHILKTDLLRYDKEWTPKLNAEDSTVLVILKLWPIGCACLRERVQEHRRWSGDRIRHRRVPAHLSCFRRTLLASGSTKLSTAGVAARV